MEKILVRKLESLCSTTALTGLQQALYDYSVFAAFAGPSVTIAGAVSGLVIFPIKYYFGVVSPGAKTPTVITVPPIFINPVNGDNYFLGPTPGITPP